MIPMWQEEFVKSISNSIFFANRNDDTSLRQSLVLLDNSVEQFLKDCVNNKKNKKDEFFKFHLLFEAFKDEFSIAEDIISKINEFHQLRNILYHKSVYVSITLVRFNEYVELIKEVCEELKLFNLFIEVDKYTKVLRKELEIEIEHIKNNKRSVGYNLLEDTLVSCFELVSNEFVGDFMLASPIGYSVAAKNMIFIVNSFLKSNKENVRILELIESNTENAYHSFFVSLGNNKLWFSYIDSIWSKYGDGNDKYCKDIKKFINDNNDRIMYRKDYIRKGVLKEYFS